MKLHLPVSLHKALLVCFAVVASITQGATVVVSEMSRVSEAAVDNTITIDYANPEATIPHANGALQFTPVTPENKGISLNLNNTGLGDGKTYELFTGVTRLVDAAGNTITLDSSNNAISNYFDTTQPGTGFWADATLQLSADGILRLVRHSEAVKPAVTNSTRLDYQYYEGVTFSGNTSSSSYPDGGAIYGGEDSTITLSNNGSVTFSGNTASSSDYYAYGGAISGFNGSTITLSDNGSVTFSGNTASSSDYPACGGAISGGLYSTITLSDNGSVTFSGNTASSAGGAIYGSFYSTITLSNNGSVTFSGNTASGSAGGAIFAGLDSTITLSNNGSVTFSGNTASSSGSYAAGGAIDISGDLSIRNNGSVEFYQNAEVVNGNTYRLRSIYASAGRGDEISLSAAAGKSIIFRDSVYIWSESTFKLNEQYEGQAQQGDIIFTGATTVDDLYTVKGNVAGTAEEIRLSRTSEVYTLTELYGGRLRVEEGAIYQGRGITAMVGSAATVRVQNAELSHVGYNLTFNDGTALEVAGESTIRGLVNLQEGSVFKLEQGATLNLYETNGGALSVGGLAWLEGASTLNADLTLAEGASLDMVFLDAGAVAVNGVLTFGGQVTLGENLLALLDEKLGYESSITLFTGLENVDWATVTGNAVSDCVWAGAVFSNMAGNHSYYLNYASDTGSLVMQIVPEPATATLSLLALAALAARRRRN